MEKINRYIYITNFAGYSWVKYNSGIEKWVYNDKLFNSNGKMKKDILSASSAYEKIIPHKGRKNFTEKAIRRHIRKISKYLPKGIGFIGAPKYVGQKRLLLYTR